ncbi:hypothetical protein P7C70_g1514, partial [Phenoliferia sp. Uapishka_3]
MAAFPDYYSILGCDEKATPDQVSLRLVTRAGEWRTLVCGDVASADAPPFHHLLQIKTAYKKKSLQCHPDRIPAGPGSDIRRKQATVEFQATNDAYYTLSDSGRRAAYDRLRATQPAGSRTDAPGSSSSYFDFFSRGAGPAETQPDAEHVFGNVFEDMLKPEINRAIPLWSWAGAAAGATIGFIAGNLPGAALGGYGGSRLGAIRDAKGKGEHSKYIFFIRPLISGILKAVYEVFKDLGADQKAEVLKGLAAKVFGMTGIGGASR